MIQKINVKSTTKSFLEFKSKIKTLKDEDIYKGVSKRSQECSYVYHEDFL